MPTRNDLDDITQGGEDPAQLDVLDFTLPGTRNRNHPIRGRLTADGRVLREHPGMEGQWEDDLEAEEITRLLVLYARRLQRLLVFAQTAITEREAIAAALVTARQERQALAAAVATLKQRIDDAGIP